MKYKMHENAVLFLGLGLAIYLYYRNKEIRLIPGITLTPLRPTPNISITPETQSVNPDKETSNFPAESQIKNPNDDPAEPPTIEENPPTLPPPNEPQQGSSKFGLRVINIGAATGVAAVFAGRVLRRGVPIEM